MKKRMTLSAALLLYTTTCSFAQGGGERVLPGTERKFIGHWVYEYEPSQAIDIYKDGSLVIVHMYSIGKDAHHSKYVASEIFENKLAFKQDKETETLVVNDDGNHIYFRGHEFDKK